MNDDSLLHAALDSYNLSSAQTHLLQSRWNSIYRVTTADGVAYSLRVCAPELKDRQWMEDELTFSRSHRSCVGTQA